MSQMTFQKDGEYIVAYINGKEVGRGKMSEIGGASYVAGTGIVINENEISIDTNIVATKSDVSRKYTHAIELNISFDSGTQWVFELSVVFTVQSSRQEQYTLEILAQDLGKYIVSSGINLLANGSCSVGGTAAIEQVVGIDNFGISNNQLNIGLVLRHDNSVRLSYAPRTYDMLSKRIQFVDNIIDL